MRGTVGRKTVFWLDLFAKVAWFIGQPFAFFVFWIALPILWLLIILSQCGVISFAA